ncbi:MAG: ribbon-helix-helix domain-containing protein [Terriglobia bacterium]|jgi:metal-responsive CopG/Arc/MetJ family transcriptional regulator
MKTKTSITLSRDLLKRIDRLAGARRSRSAFIESVLRRHLAERAKAARDARELEILNRTADEMNAEVEDVLRYQAPVDFYDSEL